MRIRDAAALLCMALLFCAPLADRARAAGPTLTSDDGRIQLQLPDGWHGETPDKAGWLKAAKDRLYVIVISENKEDFSDIKAYADLVTKQMLSKLKDVEASEGQKVEVGGRPALRYEIAGTISNGLRIIYLTTIVETEGRFNQVLAWTVRSEYASHKQELAELANGLRELPPPHAH